MAKVHAQKVTLNESLATQHGEMLAEVGNTLAVELHHMEFAPLDYEVLGESSGAWTYLQHRQGWGGIYRIGYTSRYAYVGQKMLAERLLGFYIASSHGGDAFGCAKVCKSGGMFVLSVGKKWHIELINIIM